jgi:hypothetical protein
MSPQIVTLYGHDCGRLVYKNTHLLSTAVSSIFLDIDLSALLCPPFISGNHAAVDWIIYDVAGKFPPNCPRPSTDTDVDLR